MAQRILYFTAGPFPTEDEIAEIALLNAACVQPYECTVLNGAASAEYGADRPVPGDFAAGTIPEAFEDLDEIDPDAIPNAPLLETQAIVDDNQSIALSGSNGNAIIQIEDFEIVSAALALPTTKAVVANGQVLTLSNGGTATLTITGNAITVATYAAP